MVKIGCCGYPTSHLEYYNHFDTIEINITFYQLPTLKTAEKWRKEAPSDFEFIIKAWQIITHPKGSLTYKKLKEKIPEEKKEDLGFFKDTDIVHNAWERTKEFAESLGCTKILFQCPPRFRPSDENIKNMKTFFNSIAREGFSLIWEPRGEWSDELIRKLCSELDLTHCVDPTVEKPLYGDFNYFRLHGRYIGKRIDYNHQFSDSELETILSSCNKPINYVMFNNSAMFEDALRLKKRL